MRLIDADALHELLDNGYDRDFDELLITKQALLNIIDYQDTIDAAQVVRCKDCAFLEVSGCYGECGKALLGLVSPNDYCSRGERKEKRNER